MKARPKIRHYLIMAAVELRRRTRRVMNRPHHSTKSFNGCLQREVIEKTEIYNYNVHMTTKYHLKAER